MKLRELARQIEFARHVPAAKLGRRIWLESARRLAERIPPRRRLSAPQLAPSPPQPLFPPRPEGAQRLADGWRFEFLRRSLETSRRPDWRLPRDGASQQLWRMHLHYMEYLEGLDDADFALLVEDWIAANPPYRPGYWRDAWNSYALSIRVVVWMQQAASRRLGPDTDEFRRMAASLAEQLRFLVRNLETDIGGNHLVKNIKALAWASCFFEGADADDWRRLAVDLLERELPRQILDDGVHAERSASYHAQVFADLLEIRWALGADPLGGAVDRALAGMAQAVADLTHPDGGPVLFNDAGLTMAYRPAACLAAYSRIFGAAPSARSVFAFPAAGYFGARNERMFVTADCGPLAPDDLPAHGHGDILSFELSVDGHRFIVDQGVFEYVAGPKRQAARTAANHNTLCIPGADQADFFGAFRVGRRPRPKVLDHEIHPDGFVLEGRHDGFAYLKGAPLHARRFDVGPERIAIKDRVSGRHHGEMVAGFLLHPEVRCEPTADGARLTRGHSVVEIRCSAPLVAESAVWWPDLGSETQTTRLRARAPIPGPEIQTVIELEGSR